MHNQKRCFPSHIQRRKSTKTETQSTKTTKLNRKINNEAKPREIKNKEGSWQQLRTQAANARTEPTNLDLPNPNPNPSAQNPGDGGIKGSKQRICAKIFLPQVKVLFSSISFCFLFFAQSKNSNIRFSICQSELESNSLKRLVC